MVIEIYISKAYYGVCWLYLILLLIHIGFTLPIVNWIMGCFTFTSYVFLINGSASIF